MFFVRILEKKEYIYQKMDLYEEIIILKAAAVKSLTGQGSGREGKRLFGIPVSTVPGAYEVKGAAVGTIRILDGAISTIVKRTVLGIEGVARLSGSSIIDDFADDASGTAVPDLEADQRIFLFNKPSAVFRKTFFMICPKRRIQLILCLEDGLVMQMQITDRKQTHFLSRLSTRTASFVFR